jgi:hypoxanthine-DNA glycosylase
MQVVHEISPVYNSESTVLILGSMPSVASRKAGFFYMHPQNRFWQVMSEVFSETFVHKNNSADKEAAIAERKEFLLRHKIALWDVLAECEIKGSQDSSIKQAIPNDFTQIIADSKIRQIFCTGKTAFSLYQKHCGTLYDVPFDYLPSTSPANQTWSKEKLIEEYRNKLIYF